MKTQIIESILFFTGEAIDIKYLREFLDLSEEELEVSLANLRKKYNEESGIILKENDGKIVFQTNEKYYDTLIIFFDIKTTKDLTKAALEVLSIIAYRQPVTKAQIDEIRGVKSDNIIKKLLDEDFIYISDTLDAPGRPNLYMTTSTFLRRFNIEKIDDLPEVEYDNK